MKTALFLSLTLFAANFAWGYTQTEVFKVSQPHSKVREATEQGLGISKQEAKEKREILAWKKSRPGKYDNLNTSPNRHITEIQGGLGQVEPAKALAKLYLMKHINNNWSKLRQTVFIDTPADSWTEAQRYIKDELIKINYVPTDSKEFIRFEMPWGYALVKKDLREVRTGIQVASHLDGNKLPEGAENIHIPDDRQE
jgi:hypothetical protein